MASALTELVQDEDLLARLEATQLGHRDMAWQDSEHKEVLADIAEYLLVRYGAVPAGAVDKDVSELLKEADYDDPGEVRRATDEELLAIDGIGPKKLQEIRDATGPHEPPEPPEENDARPKTLAAALDEDLVQLLRRNNYLDVVQVVAASDEELLAIKGIGPKKLAELRGAVG